MSIFKRNIVKPRHLAQGMLESVAPYHIDSIDLASNFATRDTLFKLTRRNVSHVVGISDECIVGMDFDQLAMDAKLAANKLAEWPSLLKAQ